MSNAEASSAAARARRFFAARSQGAVPLARLLWRDLLLVGTALNVLATVLALALFAARAPALLAAAVHLSPIPYNLFLCIAVWRRVAVAEPGEPGATFARLTSLLWLILVLVL